MEVSQNPLLTKSGCYWVTIVNLMEGQRQNSKCFAKCTIFVQLQQYSVSTGLCLSCVNPENLVKIHQQTWILWTFEGSASVSFSRSRKIHVSRLICTQFSGFTQDNQIPLLTEFRGHWTKIVDLREEISLQILYVCFQMICNSHLEFILLSQINMKLWSIPILIIFTANEDFLLALRWCDYVPNAHVPKDEGQIAAKWLTWTKAYLAVGLPGRWLPWPKAYLAEG